MKNGCFIPVNDVPNENELLGLTTDTVTEGTVGVDVLPATEADTMKHAGMNNGQVDFVWGFMFMDMPSMFVEGNKIYFNGEISKASITDLKRAVNEVGKITLMKYHELGIHDVREMHIELHINSPGGCMSSGFDFIDFMDNFYMPIHTVGTGTVASMGVMVLLAGTKRTLTKNTHVLVHQFRAGVNGKRQDIMDYVKHFEHIQNQAVSFIEQNTKLDTIQVTRMLKNETWLTAREALDMGFADMLN